MPFNTALSGLQAASGDLRVIGNNVANASTPGFKKSRAEFADVYAASALGVSSTAIGTGVTMNKVSQQFSQGTIAFTEGNLDLAINGQGFFVLNDGGSIAYSRVGSFGVDNSGFITNSANQKLTGFLADSSGNITGAQGSLQINTSNLAPQASATISLKANLDSQATPPTVPFVSGFTPATPPDPSSYTASTSTTIYDSLGNSHILTTYFVKAPQANQWRVHIGIDGTDQTPTAATPPAGAPPQAYPPGEVPSPYTVVFSDTGSYVLNNPSAPPQYYGAGPVTSTDTLIANSGNLNKLDLGDLVINGSAVTAAKASDDIFSSSDASASAIATASAINASTNLHGVTATPNATTINLGAFTAGDLLSGDFTINGRAINGTITNNTDLLTAINGETALTGVVATENAGDIILTAANGRNIQIQSDGSTASSATFANFDLDGGVALNQVKRATMQLSSLDNQSIIIGGNAPGKVGLSLGPLAGIIYSNSDPINLTTWQPGDGAAGPQNLLITLEGSTQFGSPFAIQSLKQDGFSTGRLSSVDVSSTGIISARYSNGQSQQLGQVALANFSNSQGLQPQGDTSWAETFASGTALVGAPGTASLGVIQSGALEDSNVQLTDELVSLIVAQRNFQANAQTIRTADAVTQSIINIR